jgi:hypothetical protein
MSVKIVSGAYPGQGLPGPTTTETTSPDTPPDGNAQHHDKAHKGPRPLPPPARGNLPLRQRRPPPRQTRPDDLQDGELESDGRTLEDEPELNTLRRAPSHDHVRKQFDEPDQQSDASDRRESAGELQADLHRARGRLSSTQHSADGQASGPPTVAASRRTAFSDAALGNVFDAEALASHRATGQPAPLQMLAAALLGRVRQPSADLSAPALPWWSAARQRHVVQAFIAAFGESSPGSTDLQSVKQALLQFAPARPAPGAEHLSDKQKNALALAPLQALAAGQRRRSVAETSSRIDALQMLPPGGPSESDR